MEEYEDVVKAGSKLVRQHFQLDVIADHGKNVLFDHDQAFARKPYYMVDEMLVFRISDRIELFRFPCLCQLFGKDY